MTTGRTLFQLGFEISPIILNNGIATDIPGGMLPIVSLTEAANFLKGILGGSGDVNPDQFFAHFRPIAGSTLIENTIGEYPFANQSVAANAIIAQPLRMSLRMDCPAQGELGYVAKLATLTALQAVLARHATLGGTYTVATPSFIWTNGILLRLSDISGGNDNQVQVSWQWDFEFPLITLAQAANAKNQLMTAVTNATPTDGSWSGLVSTEGFQNSLATPLVLPAASGLSGASAALPSLGGNIAITGSGG